MTWITFTSILSLCIGFAPLCYALVDIKDFIPFGEKVNDTNLADNIATLNRSGLPDLDDGSSHPIRLSANFQFFDKTYNTVYVNINGGVSFNSPINEYTPNCSSLSRAMISPFWADIVLWRSAPGKAYYRQTTDPDVLNNTLVDIKTAFPDIKDLTQMKWAFIVTWYKVAFFGEVKYVDRLNTFQMAMVSDDKYSFVIFNYNNITWTTGKASNGNSSGLGGKQARAGFDDGKTRLFILPGSCEHSILNIASHKMRNGPGKFVFRVDSENIIVPASVPTLAVITDKVSRNIVTLPATRPTIASLTTLSEEEEEFRNHFNRTDRRIKNIRIRLLKLCDRLIERPALQKECTKDLQKLNNLDHELRLTKHMDELKRVEKAVEKITIVLDRIEKDISFFMLS